MPGDVLGEDAIFATIIVCEAYAFHKFYSSNHGRHAIYFTWYAWIIDALAIVSGNVIMSLSVISFHHQEWFAIKLPFVMFLFPFILGSWQACIHITKWLLRFYAPTHRNIVSPFYDRPIQRSDIVGKVNADHVTL